MEYLSRHLTHQEKRFLLKSLERYGEGWIPLSVPKNLICSWIIRYGDNYWKDQYSFNPYPESAVIRLIQERIIWIVIPSAARKKLRGQVTIPDSEILLP
jgi:uncharacterized protein YbgA (DUF1722 family)